MSTYTKIIVDQSDVTGFFIHLLHDLKLNFHPDTPFDDYIDYETKQPIFSPEQCATYQEIMDSCHGWCELNGRDIYEIAMDSMQFSAFLDGHKKITDREDMRKFLKESMDEDYPITGVTALHTYGDCYYIEEIGQKGNSIFQLIIGNTNQCADNLREIEVALFDWMEKDHSVESQQPYPEKIETRRDIVLFFSYLLLDRNTAFHPDDSFHGYVNYQSGEKTFTPEECIKFNGLMQGCHNWCEKNDTDIYLLGMDLDDFLSSHRSYSDLGTNQWVRRELRDNVPLDKVVRLHSYDDDIWIREVNDKGKLHFQCRTSNGSNLTADSLRSLEVTLYDANADRYLRNRQARRQ